MFIYFRSKIIMIFLLGIASGLPFSLTASTFTLFLAETGIDLVKIGILGLAAIPYAFKYIWAPLIDNISIPIIGKRLGHRRSWLIITQILLACSIAAVSTIDLKTNFLIIGCIAFSVAFFSATQDIIIDAFRIEMLKDDEQGVGAAAVVFGYRIGMLISSTGALYLAHIFSWKVAYFLMALCLIQGLWVVIFSKEPSIERNFFPDGSLLTWMRTSFISPFADFIKRKNCFVILMLVMSYKLCDAYVGRMLSPFFVELGFSKIEIANIVKVYGMLATFLGMGVGGYFISRSGIWFVLLFGAILQAMTNLVFVWQSIIGHDTSVLTIAIGLDNLTGGIGDAALVAYISSLTNKQFTATQYALLSSFAAFFRTTIASSSGKLAVELGWQAFFSCSLLLSLPSLFCIYLLYSARKN